MKILYCCLAVFRFTATQDFSQVFFFYSPESKLRKHSFIYHACACAAFLIAHRSQHATKISKIYRKCSFSAYMESLTETQNFPELHYFKPLDENFPNKVINYLCACAQIAVTLPKFTENVIFFNLHATFLHYLQSLESWPKFSEQSYKLLVRLRTDPSHATKIYRKSKLHYLQPFDQSFLNKVHKISVRMRTDKRTKQVIQTFIFRQC